MLHSIIPYIHVLITFIVSIYFIYRQDHYDIYYLLYLSLVNISWTLFNNECIPSFIYKKLEDHNYKLGQTTDVKDYDLVFGKKNAMIFLNYIVIMYAFNIIYLLFFSKSIESIKIPVIIALLSYILYIVMIRIKVDSYKKDQIQGIHFISHVILLGFIINAIYLK
jgi:hypothetical protein